MLPVELKHVYDYLVLYMFTLDTLKAKMWNYPYKRFVLYIAVLLAGTSVYSFFTVVIY